MFPEALKALIGKCNEKELSKDSWAKPIQVLCALFPTNAYIDRLVTIFVERSFSLWKPPMVMIWLQRNVELLSKKVCGEDVKANLANVASLRRTTFHDKAVPTHIKQLDKTDYSDHLHTLPEELLRPMRQQMPNVMNGAADLDNAEVMHIMHDMANQQIQQGHGNGDVNPIVLFFRSLLPWMNAPGQQDPRH